MSFSYSDVEGMLRPYLEMIRDLQRRVAELEAKQKARGERGT